MVVEGAGKVGALGVCGWGEDISHMVYCVRMTWLLNKYFKGLFHLSYFKIFYNLSYSPPPPTAGFFFKLQISAWNCLYLHNLTSEDLAPPLRPPFSQCPMQNLCWVFTFPSLPTLGSHPALAFSSLGMSLAVQPAAERLG